MQQISLTMLLPLLLLLFSAPPTPVGQFSAPPTSVGEANLPTLPEAVQLFQNNKVMLELLKLLPREIRKERPPFDLFYDVNTQLFY